MHKLAFLDGYLEKTNGEASDRRKYMKDLPRSQKDRTALLEEMMGQVPEEGQAGMNADLASLNADNPAATKGQRFGRAMWAGPLGVVAQDRSHENKSFVAKHKILKELLKAKQSNVADI